MGFTRKGSPEKQNAIKVTGAVNKEQQVEDIVCSKCKAKIGTMKGNIAIVAGEMTIGLGKPVIVCENCKGK